MATSLREQDVRQLGGDTKSIAQVSDAGTRVKVILQANQMKANCKKLFGDFDPKKTGTMPWKALKRLIEMQGITLSQNDAQKLYRLLIVKGDAEMVNYKEALSHLQPNLELADPISGVWVLRKGGMQGDSVSRMGFSSRMSIISQTPSKISMKDLNNPVSLTKDGRISIVPPIKKFVPRDASPRQNTVATADSTVVNQEIETAQDYLAKKFPKKATVQVQPTTPVKTYDAVKRMRDITDKVGPIGLSGQQVVHVNGLTPTRIDTEKNKAEAAFKSHVDKIKERNTDSDNKLMGLGGMLDEIIKGKRADKGNINNRPTNTADLYQMEDQNMLHRRALDDYPEYQKDGSFKRAIEDPAQSPAKAIKDNENQHRSSLVNQASAMKAKNNAQYIQKLVQDGGMTQGKMMLIKLWNQKEVDFRIMFSFKNQLYGSQFLSPDNKIPISEFCQIRSQHDHQQIRQKVMGTEDLILAEMADPETDLVDLNEFSDLIDLFMFLPNTEKVNNQQVSPSMFGVLSSNFKNSATAEDSKETSEDIHLRRAMEFVWIRIQERFKKISPAFRFFDVSCNGRISYDHFVISLETLKVKLSSKDILMVFNHLDQERKGFITYHDFCNLSDERRMNLDPATAMLEQFKEHGKVVTKTGRSQSPSPYQNALTREASANSGTRRQALNTEKTDLEVYLNTLNLQDLETVLRERKSSKNLTGGPMVVGQSSNVGRPKMGYSMPRQMAREDIQFGKPSFNKKGHHSDLKQVLSNDGLRDELLGNIQKYLSTEILAEQHEARKGRTDNRTSELRKEHIMRNQIKMGYGTIDHSALRGANSRNNKSQTQSMQDGANRDPFKARSKSVLPPIGQPQNRDVYQTLGQRKGSDFLTSRTPGKLIKLDQLDLTSETRSVYKLDTSQDQGQRQHKIGNAFQNLDMVDKAMLLDKLHNLRILAVEKQNGEEPIKPHLPQMSGNEKDKIMAQYYAAKRQMKPEKR